ncbi:hypothetical protein D1BOALGB6SA_1491 [Olavius sp. associated proteobacterium Delta 1]|nr:hypothetical protein D1BOALGB6SA_1491 [Olavius sp. associated proteobacterium Delta 1]
MIGIRKAGTLLILSFAAFLLYQSEIGAGDMCQVSSITGEVTWPDSGCGPDNKLEWDYASLPASDEQLPANGSLDVYVTGGKGPYTWKVTDPGYSFGSVGGPKETTSSNTSIALFADGSACGSVMVTVKDSCGHSETTGYVRGPGGWVEQTLDETDPAKNCPIPGPLTSTSGPSNKIRVQGMWKVMAERHSYGLNVGQCEDIGDDSCADTCLDWSTISFGDCHYTMGCYECITGIKGDCYNDSDSQFRCRCVTRFTLFKWEGCAP